MGDENVADVRRKLLEREGVGLRKYGVSTSERFDLDDDAWAKHLEEELMDALVYIQAWRRTRAASRTAAPGREDAK